MKKFLLLTLFFAAAAAIMSGCSDDDDTQTPPMILLRTDRSVSVARDRTSFTLGYKISGDVTGRSVTVVPHGSWITVKKVTPDQISLAFEVNEEMELREGSVDLMAEDLATVTVTFRQAGLLEIKVEQNEISIPLNAKEVSIPYTLLNAPSYALVKVTPQVSWLINKRIERNCAFLTVEKEGVGERSGFVTLSYPGAEEVDVLVRQTSSVAPEEEE